MAYTLFDLAGLLRQQSIYLARIYDNTLLGNLNSEYLYGDTLVTSSLTDNTLLKSRDKILAGFGDDAVYGGLGDDYLNGQGGNDFLDGGNGDDILMGENGNDILYGGKGSDFLNGGAGIDDMRGGEGDDIYVVDNIADKVTEVKTPNGQESNDRVMSSVSYTLGANIETLVLTGTDSVNATGNELDNVLYGNSGVNILTGGEGNDKYYVQNSNDVVDENSTHAGTEWNIIFSTVSFTLTPGSQIDEFILTGSASAIARGNEQDNLIEGNAGSNKIYGGDGNDTLSGIPIDVELANDKSTWKEIIGHFTQDQGLDYLYGGSGDDVIFVGYSDKVIEYANEGIDTVIAGYSRTLEANVENLSFYGKHGTTDRLTGTGNNLDNVMTSNVGADTLIGKGGDDTYVVYNSAVSVREIANEGHDSVIAYVDFKLPNYVEDLILGSPDEGYVGLVGIGNGLDNMIVGNERDNILDGRAGDDLLYGGDGNDELTGGAGADTFVFDTALDATKNVDTIHDFVSGVDTIKLDSTIFSLQLGSLDPSNFLQGSGNGNAPAHADERILLDTDSGTLYYDPDGNGAADPVAFAIIHPGPNGFSLAASDFSVA